MASEESKSSNRSTTLWTAVVTGGASLASSSTNVLIADVNDRDGLALAEEVKHKFSAEAVFQLVDVSCEDALERMVKTVVDRWGRLDYAANVAGTGETVSQEEQSITVDAVNKAFAINQRGTRLCQEIEAEQMMSQDP
ncbi:hypothetical protein LTS07_011445 [Exophiala sideris]|uniref:Uncharacterized protein n=1 Tax=Exophiala sideris TaxID=1016849 RepID=A0ABR0IU49_9EURO|nr:hypothetical protein LTS07_011445 [Exophiala sideris]KAK5022718.1 hypothetical protein LTR13_011418 [Exophiala sideris]KAK5048117.1 hypothetical protein LTR69_011450 [Exophiala sideris]KAK5175945.1 hypothetical protein LTR44_011496 [Eurotiomycetes sp. CCFEE 6388]